MQVRIANAPVSFGVFGLASDDWEPPTGPALLAAVASVGYTGIDLGPPGWLGEGAQLRSRLDEVGLELAGGWVDLPFHDDAAYRVRLFELDRALDLFVAGRGASPAWWPKPTLAITGSAAREACLGGSATRPEIALDDEQWRTVGANVNDAVARCRAVGLEPTFHHHAGTHVESPAEIERLLELTDVGLTLDTGHLLMAGGDPASAFHDWGDRINHVHVKDVLLGEVDDAVRHGADLHEVWRRNLFCPLGKGSLDLQETVAALHRIGYEGWVVVEQDVIPRAGDGFDDILLDQASNLVQLTAAGLSDVARG
ncbi:MAG: TIM barrel protein [Actinomycetes bacterium]